MSIADEKALRDLEYLKLMGIVSFHCSSPLGVEAIESLVPISDRAVIERTIAEVGEAIAFLESGRRFSLGGASDLAPLLERAKGGGVLDGEDFLPVLRTIEATRRVRGLFSADEFPALSSYAGRLTGGGREIEEGIRRTIDEHGEVRETASKLLSRLIKKKRFLEGRIEGKLRSLIDRNPELISESVITRRGGRLVVPIRSGALGAMEFIVHDRSSTGQTLYAEPSFLVAENNVLAGLTGEIRDEIHRILRELTDLFVSCGPALLRDRAILAHLDSLFGRAGYAAAHRCSFPAIGVRIALRDARHPLLPAEKVVPISLSLGREERMMVITGPNTGGKTVTLKTLGLLSAMFQAGIPIPASPDSELPILSRIRTDIGDEQSIEQNLSTFSAHMKNIVSILAEADSGSLVLLDELGAGTDPQEGAALGVAVIEDLLEKGGFTVVSTHLTPLKYLAFRHPRIKTASMGFDPASLSPTFSVIEGLPGRSNAFVIAERLGLPERLIERARGFLSTGEVRAEDVIEQLHREREALSAHRKAARSEEEEARRLRQDYERRLAAFEKEREAALSERLRRLEGFLRDGQKRIESILAQAKAGTDPERLRDDIHAVSELREAARGFRKEEGSPASRPLAELAEGDKVHVHSVGADGRIVHVDPKGKVTVDLDGIRVLTDPTDLFPPRGERASDSSPSRPSRRIPRPERVPLQLNVRGMTVSEALREVESYLDRLLRADIRSASILHGKGTGALRDAIRAYLSSCTFVRSYGSPPPNRGGEGVTLFEIAGEDDD